MKNNILITLLLLSTWTIQAQSNQIILQLEEHIKKSYFKTNKSHTSFRSLTSVKQLSKNLNIWLVETSAINKQQALAELLKHPEIKAAQLNQAVIYRTQPNDPLFEAQWQYNNKGEFDGLTDADIDAPKVWNITTGGLTATNDEIVVAIIDGGINLNHPDLINNIRALAWYSGCRNYWSRR